MDIVTHRYSCYIFPEQLYLVFGEAKNNGGEIMKGVKINDIKYSQTGWQN